MIPSAFDYEVAESVEHAIELLGGDRDAKLLSGGHSLLPAMRLRFAVPDVLVDLGRLDELRGAREEGDELVIGALSRHADVARDPLVVRHCAVLAQAAGMIGDRQVRHRGTIGGSVAHADANADFGAVLVALDAQIVARGPAGERRLAADGFFRSWFETALGEQDVLTEIRVPKGTTGTYMKHTRRTLDWATVGVAAVRVAGRVQVGLTSMGPTPLRARGVEEALDAGADAAAAAARAAEDTSPVDDAMASGEYREHLARVLTRRALGRL